MLVQSSYETILNKDLSQGTISFKIVNKINNKILKQVKFKG